LGDYEVGHSLFSYFPLAAYAPLVFAFVGGNLLQLYSGHEPAVCIGLFRKHYPPENLSVGDNYATFHFSFSHEPLLVKALLALSLNRWLDSQGGTHNA